MSQTREVGGTAGVGGVRRVVFDADQIAARVAELGRDISAAYPRDEPVLILGLLKGSFIFMADLVRQLSRPVMLDFLVASSYGNSTVTSGIVRLLYDPETDLAGKHVILVDDIVDSGTTINRLVPLLEERDPRSIEICALLHKRVSGGLAREPRWVGFDAPKEFLVGYGLDHGEHFRQLPFIGGLESPE